MRGEPLERIAVRKPRALRAATASPRVGKSVELQIGFEQFGRSARSTDGTRANA